MEALRETKEFKKRFGNVAIDMGFITVDQLCEALAIQVREEVENSRHYPIGAVLYKQGIMTFKQIDAVLQAMRSVSSV